MVMETYFYNQLKIQCVHSWKWWKPLSNTNHVWMFTVQWYWAINKYLTDKTLLLSFSWWSCIWRFLTVWHSNTITLITLNWWTRYQMYRSDSITSLSIGCSCHDKLSSSDASIYIEWIKAMISSEHCLQMSSCCTNVHQHEWICNFVSTQKLIIRWSHFLNFFQLFRQKWFVCCCIRRKNFNSDC